MAQLTLRGFASVSGRLITRLTSLSTFEWYNRSDALSFHSRKARGTCVRTANKRTPTLQVRPTYTDLARRMPPCVRHSHSSARGNCTHVATDLCDVTLSNASLVSVCVHTLYARSVRSSLKPLMTCCVPSVKNKSISWSFVYTELS